MSFYIFFIIMFCGWVEKARPQNLVPNWSFEEYNDSCTNQFDPGHFINVKEWYPRFYNGYVNALTSFSTPDYYSSCSPFTSYYPPNIIASGFQYPYHQESFVGIGMFIYPIFIEREAIRIELNEPLKKDICYHAEFYCNLHNNAGYVFDKLGMVLTVDSFLMLSNGSLPYPSSQVYSSTYVYDTLNWVKIEGNFTAVGGEKWLTIGWMFDSTEISFDSIPFGSGLKYTYYYIDAVQIYPCTDEEEAVILPNLISPNGDGKNDFYIIDSLPPFSKVSFFNRWGNEVYNSENYQNDWDGTYLGRPLPTGTYYVVVQMPYGTKKSTYVELVY